MSFEDYICIEEALRINQKSSDAYKLNLLKANNLFEMGNFKEASIIVDGLLEKCLIFNTITFNTLIKLSFFLGKSNMIFNVIERENSKFHSLDDDYFYIRAVKRYSNFVKDGTGYPVKELQESADDRTKKSFLYYICYLTCKEEAHGKEFLRLSIKEFPFNLSVVQELVSQREVVNDNSLKFAFEVDASFLNNINFCSRETKGINSDNLNLEVFTLGGGDNIGGSCYVLSFAEARIMVDAGAFVSKENVLTYPNFDDLEAKYGNIFETLDYFFITHGHLDHCGAILEVYKRNPCIRILMTEETREIVRANLTSGRIAFADELKLDKCLKMATVVPFRHPLKLKCKDNSTMDIELFRAGHILGASSIYVRNKETGVFITGDYCLYNQETVEGMDIPNDYNIDLLITETTYGNRRNEELASRSFEEKKFIYTVKNAFKSGKKLLIPSFSIGRAQEIISILKKQINIHENERLYIDGMVMEINKIYEKYLNVEFRGMNIYSFDDRLYDSKNDFIKQEILNNKSCVVASSGMLQKGSAVMEYAKEFLKREDCICILTGYQAEDTVGSGLKNQMNLDGDKYISIDQELIKIRCELTEAKLSAHCSMEEILVLVSKIKPKKVLLVHGNAAREQSLIHEILERCTKLQIIQAKNNTLVNI